MLKFKRNLFFKIKFKNMKAPILKFLQGFDDGEFNKVMENKTFIVNNNISFF